MKLLITTQVLDRDDPGYFGFFHAWVEEFARHCESVEVICLREGTHALPANVRVHSLGKERGRPRLGTVVYGLRLVRLAWRLRSRYDTVFVHMNPEYIVCAGLMWRMLGKRIGLWYAHKRVSLMLRLGVLISHVALTSSSHGLQIAGAKRRIVGQGIDTRFVPGQKNASDRLRLMYWGRLSPSKQLNEILAAAQELERRGTPVSVTFVGEPGHEGDRAYAQAVQAHAKTLGFPVHFLGGKPHRELPTLVRQADVCVNISTTGSMDKTVLEAMAAGIPVVASNDSYREVLSSSGLFADDISAAPLADRIAHAARADTAPLVAYVAAHHSVAGLIGRILRELRH